MERLNIKAAYLAKTFDLDRIAQKLEEHEARRLHNRIIFKLGDSHFAVFYSFGVAVFLGATAAEEKLTLRAIRSALREPIAKGWSDAYAVEVDPTLVESVVESDCARIPALNLDYIDLICRILAQSVAITQFDIGVDQMVEQFRGVYDGLRTSGRLNLRPRTLLQSIGANHDIIRTIIAEISLLNIPQITWSDAKMERLWLDLREFFDLEARFERLEFKIGFLRESTQQLLDVIQARRAEILELAIIGLFVIDIVILIFELLG